MPNPFFFYKKTVLFQAILFSISTVSLSKHSYFKLLSLIQIIQFSMNIVFIYTQLNFKLFIFQTIQFSISTQIKCQNSFISSNAV